MVREALAGYRLHGMSMHRNVELFERDMLLAFERMFADPEARAIHPLERRARARLYMVLAGSFFRVGSWSRSMVYGARSLRLDPRGLRHLATLPARRLRGRAFSAML
jgi:hypothetical protein